MRLEALWQSRRERYLRDVLPYWRYVLSSGGAAMGFVAILATQGYFALLAQTRESGAAPWWLPAAAAGLAAFGLLWNPVRTYLREPDLVFLRPLEGRMDEYARAGRRLGLLWSGGWTVAALALYWPFYAALRGEEGGAPAYAVVCALLLLVKALLHRGAWIERRFRERALVAAFAAAKTIAAFATAYAALRGVDGFAALAAYAAAWGGYAAALRLPDARGVRWERLLRQERRTRALHEAWFGFFVDLPSRASGYKPRPYWNPLLRLVRYERSNAALYMYWRTFLRSSILTLAARLVVLFAALVALFPAPWTAAAIYAAGCWLLGLQLRAVRNAPSDPLLSVVSPISAEERERALRAVQRSAGAIGVALMAAPLFASLSPVWAAGCMTFGLGTAFLFASRRTSEV